LSFVSCAKPDRQYFGGYSNCKPTSAKYGHDLLLASLALTDPPVSGVTVYTTEVPKGKCPNDADKGCIVKELFGKAAAPPGALRVL
jgi:hypothetical protein